MRGKKIFFKKFQCLLGILMLYWIYCVLFVDDIFANSNANLHAQIEQIQKFSNDYLKKIGLTGGNYSWLCLGGY